MHSRMSMIVIAAIVIAFAAVVIVSTVAGGDGPATHTMPDGGSMRNEDMP